jgi:hypothetical protein
MRTYQIAIVALLAIGCSNAGDDSSSVKAKANPVGIADPISTADGGSASTGNGADGSIDASAPTPACVPTTCEALGYTCGSFDNCGKVQTCGTCGGIDFCSLDTGGTCQPYPQLCPAQTLTFLGACMHNARADQLNEPETCSLTYHNYEVTEYRDNTTALPALTLKDECLALDTPYPYTCANDMQATAHVYTWSDSKPAHTGQVGCRVEAYKNGNCSDTVTWYDTAINDENASERCTYAHGTIVTN